MCVHKWIEKMFLFLFIFGFFEQQKNENDRKRGKIKKRIKSMKRGDETTERMMVERKWNCIDNEIIQKGERR